MLEQRTLAKPSRATIPPKRSNWDLIPQSAIASIQLIPGSNPAFGLNTLGGAVAVYTKSGAQYPGGGLELSGGSFGGRAGTGDTD